MNTNDRSIAAAIQKPRKKTDLHHVQFVAVKKAREQVDRLHERRPNGLGGFVDGFRFETDRAYAQGLAELLPIVDLLANDLARVAAERDRAIEERDRITRLWDRARGMI